jgi:hypothetical protein
MPTAIPFKNISIKITYVIYYYLYLIIIKQKVWKGITTLQRLRGAIFLDRTHPVLPDRTAFGPLQDEALQPVLSPLPSTGRGPPDGPLHCPLQDEVLFKALSVALYWTRPSAHSPETRRLALPRTRPYQHNSSKA